jgi:hypothetical protein
LPQLARRLLSMNLTYLGALLIFEVVEHTPCDRIVVRGDPEDIDGLSTGTVSIFEDETKPLALLGRQTVALPDQELVQPAMTGLRT